MASQCRSGEVTGEEPDHGQPSPLALAITAQEFERYRAALARLKNDDQIGMPGMRADELAGAIDVADDSQLFAAHLAQMVHNRRRFRIARLSQQEDRECRSP